MLSAGPYPAFLKERVGGQWGHLNNQQTARLISVVAQERLQHLVIGHISEKNNSLEMVKSAIEDVYRAEGSIFYACKQEGFDWLTLI